MIIIFNYRIYSKLPDMPKSKVWAEIDTSALVYNYKQLTRDFDGDIARFCVVKADAYGHGAEKCVIALIDAGCRHFAVSCVEEAIEVRTVCNSRNCNALILILGYTPPEEAGYLAKYDITQALLSLDYAQALSKFAVEAKVSVKVHIAVDTGMNRIGFPAYDNACREASALQIVRATTLEGIKITGMFTHFAQADDPEETVYLDGSKTNLQYDRFTDLKDKLSVKGINPQLCHVCNSAGTVRFKNMAQNGIRLGIMLYGYPASGYMDMPYLRPVMRLNTLISHLHTVLPGEKVGYGGTFTVEKPTLVATLPIGYADGFTRNYAGGIVTIHTQNGIRTANIVGRICMDQCMVDVTGIDCKVGDTVNLFGETQGQLMELAKLGRTIEYETLCAISARVPRVYVNG